MITKDEFLTKLGKHEENLADPVVSARIAMHYTRVPILLVLDDNEEPHGVYRREKWAEETNPVIEVYGPRNNIMTTYTIWHEVGHHKYPLVNTTVPEIIQEAQAELWACDFFSHFLPSHHETVLKDARDRMRSICGYWYELDMPHIHPVPQTIAEWCGWEAPDGYWQLVEDIHSGNDDEDDLPF